MECRDLRSSCRSIRKQAAHRACGANRENRAHQHSAMFPGSWSARGGCGDSRRESKPGGQAARTQLHRQRSRPQEKPNTLRMALLPSRALVWIEDLPATSHLQQKLRRLVSSGEAGVQILEPLHHDLYAKGIHVAERAATKRRESYSEYCSNISVARRPDDSVAHAARRLVEHRQ